MIVLRNCINQVVLQWRVGRTFSVCEEHIGWNRHCVTPFYAILIEEEFIRKLLQIIKYFSYHVLFADPIYPYSGIVRKIR